MDVRPPIVAEPNHLPVGLLRLAPLHPVSRWNIGPAILYGDRRSVAGIRCLATRAGRSSLLRLGSEAQLLPVFDT